LMVARGRLGPGLVAPARRRGGIAAGFARRILVRAGQGAVATALAPATAATLLLRRVGFRCRRLHVRIRRGGHPFRYVSFRRRLPGVRLVAASATSAVAAPLVAAMGFALAGIGTAAAALTTLALACRPVVRGAVRALPVDILRALLAGGGQGLAGRRPGLHQPGRLQLPARNALADVGLDVRQRDRIGLAGETDGIALGTQAR